MISVVSALLTSIIKALILAVFAGTGIFIGIKVRASVNKKKALENSNLNQEG